MGDFDRAIRDYHKAIELKSDYASAYNNREIAYSKQGELDKAIQDFSEAIRLDPDYVGGL